MYTTLSFLKEQARNAVRNLGEQAVHNLFTLHPAHLHHWFWGAGHMYVGHTPLFLMTYCIFKALTPPKNNPQL